MKGQNDELLQEKLLAKANVITSAANRLWSKFITESPRTLYKNGQLIVCIRYTKAGRVGGIMKQRRQCHSLVAFTTIQGSKRFGWE